MRETRVRRIGRATIGSAIVFGASLSLWLSHRPEERLQQTPETIPWPNVSWVIVTTTSTTTTTEPKTTTTKPKPTTSVEDTTTSIDPSSTTTFVMTPSTVNDSLTEAGTTTSSNSNP
jgi:hypothetical protein